MFLRILRCFTSPRVALPRLCIHLVVTLNYQCRVSPFGHLRIKACVPLPEAFRSLLRPSSPDDAKASIICCNWFMQTLYYSRRLSYLLTQLHFCLSELSKNKIYFQRLAAPSPTDPSPRSSRSSKWWAQMDLNHRPRAYQARALTN